ncbi:MAG TPA: hypothetical protein VIM34_12945 [Burkholderiaceae bacterium]
MPRPEPTLELTDAERRALIARTRVGQALAEKHRFLRFENKVRSSGFAVTTKVIDIVGNDTTTIVPVNVG